MPTRCNLLFQIKTALHHVPYLATPVFILLIIFPYAGRLLASSPDRADIDSSETSPLPGYPSIQEFGVLPENDPEKNRDCLQKAIDWASPRGAALFVTPSSEPYRVATGSLS